jgi:hypothetical protein
MPPPNSCHGDGEPARPPAEGSSVSPGVGPTHSVQSTPAVNLIDFGDDPPGNGPLEAATLPQAKQLPPPPVPARAGAAALAVEGQ